VGYLFHARRVGNAVGGLKRFSNTYTLNGIIKGGFFLRKKPLRSIGFGLRQLDNRSKAQHNFVALSARLKSCPDTFSLHSLNFARGSLYGIL
jgi:hypothetical protein